jgi:hypothetical protein
MRAVVMVFNRLFASAVGMESGGRKHSDQKYKYQSEMR